MGTTSGKTGLDPALEAEVEGMNANELQQLATVFEAWARQLRSEAHSREESDHAQRSRKAQAALN